MAIVAPWLMPSVSVSFTGAWNVLPPSTERAIRTLVCSFGAVPWIAV